MDTLRQVPLFQGKRLHFTLSQRKYLTNQFVFSSTLKHTRRSHLPGAGLEAAAATDVNSSTARMGLGLWDSVPFVLKRKGRAGNYISWEHAGCLTKARFSVSWYSTEHGRNRRAHVLHRQCWLRVFNTCRCPESQTRGRGWGSPGTRVHTCVHMRRLFCVRTRKSCV